MSVALLQVQGLAVRRGGVPVLQDVAFDLAPGSITALLGRNGAGKSTLLRTLIGLERADAGTLSLAGHDLAPLAPEARARLGIGYAPEGRRIFAGLTVRENLDVAGPGRAAARNARIAELETLFPDLAEKAAERAWRLSGGQQQMLAVARALMGRPRLLLLDEPTLGLAPALAASLLARLRQVAESGVAILLAEQNLPPALAVADQAIGLRQGRSVTLAPLGELRRDPGLAGAML
jgi:branched-chain amino acid transport system ATP-binding protein